MACNQRAAAFSDGSRALWPLPARGLLLRGPGHGQSLTARDCPQLGDAMLRWIFLWVGLFAGLVGSERARTRDHDRRAEAMAPACSGSMS